MENRWPSRRAGRSLDARMSSRVWSRALVFLTLLSAGRAVQWSKAATPPLPAHRPRRNLLGCLQEGNPATDVFGLPHFLEDCVCFKLIMNFDRVPPVDLLHAI